MYLMYVDESGDCGLVNSPVRYFVLSGLIIHETYWRSFLDDLILLRQSLKGQFGLKLREEIHASAMINNPLTLGRIKRNDRLDIMKQCIDWMAQKQNCRLINIVVDKQGKTGDIFEFAWRTLIQRFENTIRYRNFPGPQTQDDKGLILPDRTDNTKLQSLVRTMRRFNPAPNMQASYGVGSRNLPLDTIVEDPFFKDSNHSYFIQMVDISAYFLRQLYEPNSYLHRKSATRYFYRLYPVLCKQASRANAYGIVAI